VEAVGSFGGVIPSSGAGTRFLVTGSNLGPLMDPSGAATPVRL